MSSSNRYCHTTRDQEVTQLYANGQLFVQEFYRDGKREGERKGWCDTGQLTVHEFYRDGKNEGERKVWYANGQFRIHEFYHNGRLEGEVKEWYDNGRLHEHQFYRLGLLLGRLNLRVLMSLLAFKQRLRKRVRLRWGHKLTQKLILPLARVTSQFIL